MNQAVGGQTNDNATTALAPLGLIAPPQAPLLWTPAQSGAAASGLIVLARPRPFAVVVAGRIWERGVATDDATAQETEQTGRGRATVTLGGLVIVSSARQKEPTRVIGHPDLASGASVQRGETLYVSVAEAIYREGRGEIVEVHLTPTDEDASALGDLRVRARQRWDNDHLPDGWTRPLPPPPSPTKDESIGADDLPDELRALADRFRVKTDHATAEPHGA